MKKNYFSIIFYCLIVLSSCQKETSDPDADPITKTDVYVAGVEYSGTNSVAKYWKNGIAVNLPYASKRVEASSIYVSGNDVYVAGRVFPDNPVYPGESIAIYWKNGIAVNLSDGATANSITVSGNDVYVTGYGVFVSKNCSRCTPAFNFIAVAKYWKNGNPVILSDSLKPNSAYSICVSGNDVYVTGFENDGWIHNTAKYWKNGQPVNLTSLESETNSITVSGNDVYVAGWEDFRPTYWKNGIPVKLSDETGKANSIVVSASGDIYVAGLEHTATGAVAKYWKNGNPVTLSSKSPSDATSIAVSGNDIYVVGYENTNMIAFAGYWKSGIWINITDGVNASDASAIFIVKQ